MRATILPLKGKYYGSEMSIEYKGHEYYIQVWERTTFVPSKRELDNYCLTEKQWVDNEQVPVASLGKVWTEAAREILDTSDGHYEDKGTYEFLVALEEKLNEG